MIKTLLVALMVGLSFVGFVGHAHAANDCAGWATALGKEGRVRDSLTMHLLGCDDGPWTTTHYEPMRGTCAAVARRFARQGYYTRPRTVAALVEQTAGCTVFEDGTYAPPR